MTMMENEEIRELPICLTEKEIIECSKRLAQLTLKLEELEEKKKTAIQSYENRIEEKRMYAKYLAHKINSGQDVWPITCYWETDWQIGERRLYRSDTHDVIEVAPIPAGEWKKKLSKETKTASFKDEHPFICSGCEDC